MAMAMGLPKKEAGNYVQWARENNFEYTYALFATKEIFRSYRLGGTVNAARVKKALEDYWRDRAYGKSRTGYKDQRADCQVD